MVGVTLIFGKALFFGVIKLGMTFFEKKKVMCTSAYRKWPG